MRFDYLRNSKILAKRGMQKETAQNLCSLSGEKNLAPKKSNRPVRSGSVARQRPTQTSSLLLSVYELYAGFAIREDFRAGFANFFYQTAKQTWKVLTQGKPTFRNHKFILIFGSNFAN